ncbi:MAG: molybdenum cofactor cytidylyltransferase MocA [Rhodobacteraceae bacterium HLUCCA08]|nr:MAG: molybdenum cofactor cytidylyltransferase MocA [Rhodobacteraceae bacterium HLUCCA08]
MRFGPVPLAEATGAILAHSVPAVRVPHAMGRTYRISKGAILGAAELADIAAAGLDEVWIARPGPQEVGEDVAALRIARALAAGDPGWDLSEAATGRVNLRAAHAGVVRLDAAAVHAVNRIDPAITVATVPPWKRLPQGGLAATVKIIPFAVSQSALAEACAAAEGAMAMVPPAVVGATLIETRIGSDVPPDKGRRSMITRLARLSVRLSPRVVVPHRAPAIAAALSAAPGEVLMILTASATSDIADIAPEGLRHAGGAVDHFGMPVDPGNLLFLGRLGDKPVIGLPGCARSPAMNGADWVLDRLLCGVPVTGPDIMAMGVGGLLKEIPERGRPRDRDARGQGA